jgi:hypothetical protein
MDVLVDERTKQIADDCSVIASPAATRSRARLTNLLAIVRRHQRKIQNDASLLQSASSSSEPTVDTIPGTDD